MNRLWKKWQQLLETNPEEEGTLQIYINKYGDFRKLFNDAISTLQKLDNERPFKEKEIEKRKLEFNPYTESDAESLQSTEQSMSSPILPAAAVSTDIQPRIQHPLSTATQNLSFVDAPILSKQDLPVFEGNLLEFPEHWARFSTLVGDKPQLDGATKLSLLKSTLRGKALQTIKGYQLRQRIIP
ncbi:hypothetical protein OSTOST_25279 [Ostertagia ostertagi]